MTTVTAPVRSGTEPRAPWLGITGRDVAVAFGVGLAQVGFTVLASHHQTVRQPLDAWAIVLLLIGPAALIFRRRFPVAVLWVALVSTAAFWIADYRRGPVFLGLIVAFGTVMLHGHRRAGWVSLAAGWMIFSWGRWAFGWEPGPAIAGVLGLAAWLLVLGGGMELFRARRLQVAGLARARAEEARRQQSEERLCIARDLHDVVAHNISLINVQAGVALHLIDEHPEQARTALAAIKQASKETLGELRSVLDALRGDDAAPLAPTPGLADLEQLAKRATAAGLPVHIENAGAVRPLPRGVDLAAYRIVQEAVTNATRHATNATRVRVRLVYDADELTVEVDDDGDGTAVASPGGGAGIIGMQERAHALGGSLHTGRRPEGGFRVRARLPVDEQA